MSDYRGSNLWLKYMGFRSAGFLVRYAITCIFRMVFDVPSTQWNDLRLELNAL